MVEGGCHHAAAPPAGRDDSTEAEQTGVKATETVPALAALLLLSVTRTYTLILFNEDNYYSYKGKVSQASHYDIQSFSLFTHETLGKQEETNL